MFNNASGFAINGAQFADVQGNWVENNGQWSEYNVREQFNDNKVTTVFNANTYTGNAVHNQHTVKDTVSCIQSATRISGGSSQKSFSSRCGPGTYMQSKRSSSGSSQGSYATSKRQASSEYGDGHSNAYPLSITEPTYYSNEGSKLTIDFDPITNEPLVYVGDPNDSSQDFYTRVPAMITDDIRDFFDHTLKDAGIHLDFDSQDVDDCKGPFPLEGLEEEDVDNAAPPRVFTLVLSEGTFVGLYRHQEAEQPRYTDGQSINDRYTHSVSDSLRTDLPSITMSSHPATGLAIEFDTNDMTENYDQRDGQPEGKTHFKVNIEHPHYGGRVTVETNSPRPLRSSKRSFRTPGLHQNAIPSPVSPVEELGNNLREFHTQKKTAGDPDGPRPTMKAAQHPGLPSLPSKRSLNLGSQKKTSPSRTWAITGERERPFNDMPEGLVLDQVQTGPLEIDSEGASRNRAPRRHFISRLSLLVPLKRIFSSL